MTARRPGKVGRCSPSPSDAAEMQMLSPIKDENGWKRMKKPYFYFCFYIFLVEMRVDSKNADSKMRERIPSVFIPIADPSYTL
jgi:hypothetical protein